VRFVEAEDNFEDDTDLQQAMQQQQRAGLHQSTASAHNYDEEVSSLVIDNGSGMIRAGNVTQVCQRLHLTHVCFLSTTRLCW
jgi:hypothetical protein